jgi:hypothetical protein
LREIRVRRSTGQQLQIIAAAIGVSVQQPWPIAAAFPEPSRLERILQREAAAAVANNIRVGRIGACAGFLNPHWLLALHRPMHSPPPLDILQVALLAGADEPDRRHVGLAAVVEYEPPAALGIEILSAHQSPAPDCPRSGSDCLHLLANEPGRKNGSSDAAGNAAVTIG